MIKTILVLFFNSIVCNFINAQSYPTYYFHMHKASKYKVEKDFKMAALEYENAYTAVPNKNKFYDHASISYLFVLLKLTNYSKIQYYIKDLSKNYCKAILLDDLNYFQSYQIEMNKDSSFDTIISIVKRTKFVNDFCQQKQMPITSEVDSILIIIHRDDQRYRKNYSNTGDSVGNAINLDSINFERVFYILKNYGIPETKNYRAKFGLFAAITHTDNLQKFNRISKFLFDAVIHGKYNPANFAYAYDRALIDGGKLPIYYWGIETFDYKPKNQLEIDQVNKNRKLIGLPDFPFWNGQNIGQ